MKKIVGALVAGTLSLGTAVWGGEWIRVNQLGYLPASPKVAVYMSDEAIDLDSYALVDDCTGQEVMRFDTPRAAGLWGRMQRMYRLDFSACNRPGTYRLRAGDALSPRFVIGNRVYDGTADFILRYMRQQRCGFNPFERDSCHTHDGYIVYHPTRSGQHIDVRGGWHDASDQLQYVTTSANATYQMMFAYLKNRVFAPHIGWLDRIFIPKAERQAAAVVAADEWSGNRIITIARMYGSGGNAVGEAVARRLGCPCYNRQIIDQTAREMGYSTDFVAQTEQNLPTGRLWELIFADSGIPASMNPSKDDAIYVNQSRTIRELAHKGECVIIGRLGNWILRDDPHVLRVFITSGRDFAVKQLVDKLHISPEEAARKIERVNTGRANHYWHYTGKPWTDIAGYDLVINTERTGIDGAVDMILRAFKNVK